MVRRHRHCPVSGVSDPSRHTGATGLTFGSIAALYGLTNHLISQAQYSELVTVVILSAFVPTLIAQQFFTPDVEALPETLEEALDAEEVLPPQVRRHPRSPDQATPAQDGATGAASRLVAGRDDNDG